MIRLERKKMHQDNRKAYGLLPLRRNYQSPHTHYTQIRAYDSIYFDETSQCWLVTGHAPATTILNDPRFTSQLGVNFTSSIASISKQMIFMDGEKHTRSQHAMMRPLAVIAKKLPDEIRSFSQDLLTDKQKSGEIDLVSDFASKISLFSIARIMGIPADDWDLLLQLERWSDTFGDRTSGYFNGNSQDILHLETYFQQLIATKRQSPTDDLLSAIINDQEAFPTEEDLVANCMMIFAAGRVTTKKLLGNGIPLLLQDWEHIRQEYQAHPKTFPKMLCEELLRMVTPTRYIMRQATEDVNLSTTFPGQHLIHQGDRVLIFLEAVDRDPAIFDDPDTFSPQRRPNKHLAFGFGSHQCLGATLARIEIQSTLEALLSLPTLRLKPDSIPSWNPNPNLGGYTSCPALFQR
jgi:cytochrome P450